jgi:YfiH family protein
MDIVADQPVIARLTHGTGVAVFRRDDPGSWPDRYESVRPGSGRTARVFDADGVISNVPGLHFLLTFADCVPLVFADPVRGVIAAAHAGWRGTAAGMAGAVISALTREFGSVPDDIYVAIGPSIGPCCYEVGDDVPASFRLHGVTPVMRDKRLDLWESTVIQLEQAGVGTIEVAGICTSCTVDSYFSHRAEGGVTGRFALVAGLEA